MKTDRQHRTELAARLGRLNGLVLAALLAIASCYWFVQVVEGGYYRELAENNRLRKLAIQAPRGRIYDRAGRAMVENVPSYDLLLDRTLSHDLDASLDVAATTLATDRALLAEDLAAQRRIPTFQPVVLAEGLSLTQVARIGVHHLEHPEFDVAVRQRRLYRQARQTAHVLGYLGEVSPAELGPESPYRPGDTTGKKGVEQRYEGWLRGENGEQVVVVDSRGRWVEEYRRAPARPGRDLYLTLDLDLQQEAARLLADQVGAIVALDPRTGAVLAMASSPSFDPNQFARRIRPAEWRQLLEDPDDPLQNRAIQNLYPPGSIFKIVLATAGLELGLVDPEVKVTCRGYSVIYNHRFRCHKPGGHGPVNLEEAIQQSCNVYFHHLGQELGIEAIARYARLLGLGEPTGIELAGEEAGLVPDTRWSETVRGTPWFPGETISVATGQGPILVTPLQMAMMLAAVANGGTLLRPRLDRAAPVEVRRRLPVAPDTLARVRHALWSVVNTPRGTGRNARLDVDGVEVAGKTGTAQVIRQETRIANDALPREQRDHSWFASFAPADDPRLVVVVFIEHGGTGSTNAAPIAKALYEKFFESDLAHRAAR